MWINWQSGQVIRPMRADRALYMQGVGGVRCGGGGGKIASAWCILHLLSRALCFIFLHICYFVDYRNIRVCLGNLGVETFGFVILGLNLAQYETLGVDFGVLEGL